MGNEIEPSLGNSTHNRIRAATQLGKRARMMRLIWKAKVKIKYNRRGKSNHDRIPES